MKARLLFREKHILPKGIMEMVIWQLPEPTLERPHGIKYRLHYGTLDGRCPVRYDNEQGKGCHCHYQDQEVPYLFTNAQQLITDFLGDVARVQQEQDP
ncbi:MAG: hypothetical protein G8345_06690 [Magnetococcales bacterium]|nr:hypothetical protein [Magnetococcales bacterium]NGZ26558.1 hypothetical protein [Magnetococcales bacterium]